jgi:hypothetical protein
MHLAIIIKAILMQEYKTQWEKTKEYAKDWWNDYKVSLTLALGGTAVAVGSFYVFKAFDLPSFAYNLIDANHALENVITSTNFYLSSCDCNPAYSNAMQNVHSGISVAQANLQEAASKGFEHSQSLLESLAHANNTTCLQALKPELAGIISQQESTMNDEYGLNILVQFGTFITGAIGGCCAIGGAGDMGLTAMKKHNKKKNARNK